MFCYLTRFYTSNIFNVIKKSKISKKFIKRKRFNIWKPGALILLIKQYSSRNISFLEECFRILNSFSMLSETTLVKTILVKLFGVQKQCDQNIVILFVSLNQVNLLLKMLIGIISIVD